MSENLQNWLKNNYLDYVILKDNIIQIKNTEQFFLVIERKEKLFDEDLFLLLSEDEFILVENSIDKYKDLNFLFEFGESFYYCPCKLTKDSYNEERFKITNLSDFLYIGKSNVVEPKEGCLGIHSEYEILNVACNYNNVLKKAKFLGYKTVGICDHNTLAGTLGFQLKAKELGLKSIIGETISVVYEYDEQLSKQISFDLKVYVVDSKGWLNLLSINKLINVDNGGYILNKELLKRSEGLILVVDYSNSYFRDLRDLKEYSKLLNKYKDCFDDIYFQFSSVMFSDEKYDLKCLNGFKFYLENFHKEVKSIFIDDIYYLEASQANCKQLLNTIGGFVKQHSYNQYFKISEEVVKTLEPLFEKSKTSFKTLFFDSITNNEGLCTDCNFSIVTTERKVPTFEIDGESLTKAESDKLLRKICEEGFEKRVIGKVDSSKELEYRERLEREFKVITEAELADYFLILWDIISWARENNIRIGPGRGSVGGSLLAYLIFIIDVDPIKHDLLFERFLNEARFKITFKYEIEFEDGTKKHFNEGDLIKLIDGREIKIEDLKEIDEVQV